MYSEEQVKKMFQNALSSGDMKDVKVFENIVDKDGHPRFLEGNINIQEVAGITKDYGKWALSGTHLLIVLCITGANDTAIASTTEISELNIPKWIVDKITPLYAGISYIETKTAMWYGPAWSNQNNTVSLRKTGTPGEEVLSIRFETSLNLNTEKSSRIAFDLLIDNE